MQKCHIRERSFYTKRINYGDFGMFRSREDPHRLATEKQETESNTKKRCWVAYGVVRVLPGSPAFA
jgi:hypothetical protein